jgi:class 3 adenylate cyclase/tetratricopeptide (TPR) repeat protein
MDCQACGAANVASSRFCDQCGAPLAVACPSCGGANRPEARFCSACGYTLSRPTVAEAAAAPVGGPGGSIAGGAERRLVTVLFADLVGFTPLAEDRDPEAIRELLSTYFDRTRIVVERHGGTVEKFIGDAVMAVWGTPVAHEDDAERAVRAGLEVVATVRAMSADLEARVGVLTGEAAVDPAAVGQSMVAGDLVNTAARLQSVAPAGTVLVGETTMRAVDAAIAFEPAGEQLLKGKSAPVPAWRAVRVLAERGTGAEAELLEPPFVGREDELVLLKELLHATGRDRRLRLASITGVAGIGKSRLATELGRYVDGLVEDIYWHRGRSPSYGEGIAFWALGEMVRQRAGLAEGDDEATSRTALRAMVEAYISDETDRRWVESAVMTLLGLEPPPPGGRDVLFAAWRILFERVAEHGTTVLLFEDLHWADAGLLDFIDHLLTTARAVPILVVTLARPELFDRRPDWLVGRRNLTGIALDPLPETAMRQLLTEWVPGLPDSAVDTILSRADGIPMYAVETIRTLLADGRLERIDGTFRPTGDLTELRIPESLRSLIASRLDALDPPDRALLQDASVLGQTFSVSALAAVAGHDPDDVAARLRVLVRRELLHVEADPRSPERGQHAFVQSLVREVAYATLARRERRARHLAVARYFEAVGDPELAGALASHYLAAFHESAEGPEADALAVQARLALRAAAERAMNLGAYAQAIAHLERAVAITTTPRERAELEELTARADLWAGRYEASVAAGIAARDAFRMVPDLDGVVRAAGLIGHAQIEGSQLLEARATLTDALAELGSRPGPEADEGRARLQARLARVLMRLDERQASIEAADRALTVAERDRLEDVVVEALVNKGSALANSGRWREGTALLGAAADLAARTGDVATEIRARNNLATTLWSEQPERGVAMLEETLELGRRVGGPLVSVWQVMVIAFGEYQLARDWDRALALLDEFLEYDLSPADRGRLLGARITILIDRGEVDRTEVDEVVAIWRGLSDPDAQASPVSVDSQLAFVEGRLAEALQGRLQAADMAGANRFGELIEAAFIAMQSGDATAASSVLARIDANPDTTRLTEASRACLRAGIDAVEGRSAQAEAGFKAAFQQLGAFGWYRSRTMMTAAMLLPGAPEAPQWVADAEEVFVRCRAKPYLGMLEPVRAEVERATRQRARPGATSAASQAAPEAPVIQE